MNPQIFIAISLFVIILMFLSVARGKVKRFNLVLIWLVPVLFLSVTSDAFLQFPAPAPAMQVAIALATIVGGCAGFGIGLLRGKSMRFGVDARGVFYRNSYASVAFYAAVILIKLSVQLFFVGMPFASLLSLSLLAVSCGSIFGRRIFITYKALQLAKQADTGHDKQGAPMQ